MRGSSTGATVFVLDCCRNGLSSSVGTGRGVVSPFSRVATRPFTSRADSSAIRAQFPHSIVIYSTTSGNVADDGEMGEGGAFMGIFCDEIAKGAAVAVVMQRTVTRLDSVLDRCQLAPYTSLLKADFFFSPPRAQQVSLAPLSPMAHASTRSWQTFICW